jgi:hypothetical protein
MPTPLLDIRTGEWSELLEYFNSIAHHNTEGDGTEFVGRAVYPVS